MSTEFICIWLAGWLLTLGLTIDRLKKNGDLVVGGIMAGVMVIVWPFFLGVYIDDRVDHIQTALNRFSDVAKAIRGLKT